MVDRLELLEHHLSRGGAVLLMRPASAPLGLSFVSEEVMDALGYTAADMLGCEERWQWFVHPEDMARVRAQLTAPHAERELTIEYRMLHADGDYRTMREQTRAVKRPDGSTDLLGVWTDVTSVATNQLVIDRLGVRLTRALRELEQFAYVASHDLRAPLRAVDTLSAWLEQDLAAVLSGDAKEQMRLLRGRVKRMDRLLLDLLDYARVGRTRTPTELVDVEVLVSEIVDMSELGPLSHVAFANGLPSFVTARAPLKRVLTNLLQNAVKHNDHPMTEISIACRFRDDAYELSVTDDGPGIPKEFHERVFQIFQTLKPRDTMEGSGMGLALARRIVESAEGKLRLSSEGRGATFTFSWPAIWSDSAASSHGSLRAAPASPVDLRVGAVRP